jgi:feruloyl esterase
MQFRLAVAGMAAWLVSAIAPAHAAPSCSTEVLNALSIADLKVTEAKATPAAAQTPAFCQISGTVVTRGSGAPEGSARFVMQLPETWTQRFVFYGVGGNAGTLGPSANAVDRAAALGKGYATIVTDTGHVGDGTTAKWVRKPDGSIDQAKLIDFFHRAAHSVTVAGKAFAQAYYGAQIQHAYFDGCSTGGRMALAAAEQYPGDFTGVIAGDPAMDFNLALTRMAVQNAALRGPQSYMSQDTLIAIDKVTTERCDAIDGARDGIVQNPAKCTVKPEDLLCKANATAFCLNADQVAMLKAYVTPVKDKRGKVIYPGWAITNLSGPGAVGNYTTADTPPNRDNPAAPWSEGEKAPRGWALAHESLVSYLGGNPTSDMTKVEIDANNVISDAYLARANEIYSAGQAGEAARLLPFIAQGGKLIMYHGASDPSIPAERTIMFYKDLIALRGGVAKTQENVRLFLVPGMHHCQGGVGPDRFDTLSALEAWVEQGSPPQTLIASTRPDAVSPRKLPLCPYPQEARYNGAGDIADEKSWKCVAPNGK